MTGSDTSSNTLFATLQQTAAQAAGLDPTLMVAANTSRGVVGKDDQPAESDYRGHGRRLLGRESTSSARSSCGAWASWRCSASWWVSSRARPVVDAAMTVPAGLKVALFATCFIDMMFP